MEPSKPAKKPTNVIAEIRIMPDGLEVSLDSLMVEIKKAGNVQSMQTKDVAFGLKAVHAIFLIPDAEGAEGGMEDVEKKLSAIPGVAGVEVLNMGREVDMSDFV